MREPIIRIVRDDGMGERNPVFKIDGKPWALLRDGLEGFDGVEHEITTSPYAQYDGSTVLAHRTPDVDRTISFAAIGDVAALRGEIDSFFRAGSRYEVHVDAEGRRRFAVGSQYSLRVSVDNFARAQRVQWTFLCPDPLWMSDEEKQFDLATATRRAGFPFCSYVERAAPTMLETETLSMGRERHVKGFIVGILAKEYALENRGASTAYPRFEVKADGPVSNPRFAVKDHTGETVCQFGIKRSLSKGDVLVVDFSARPTTITLGGENVSNLAMPESTLSAGIEPGSYTLSWDADSGSAALSIVPTIRERYLTI